MKLHQIAQNTDEWMQLRTGKFTASVASDLLMDPKNKGYINLINKIAEERFTGEGCQSKVWTGNAFTERGHELEPIAIMQFEENNFTEVEPMGFVEKDSWSGCSPDGLINANKMIQVKCPIFATQIGYHTTKKVPGNYYQQMQFELYICERELNIFYSYHPKLPAVQIDVHRDEKMMQQIEVALLIAKSVVEQKIESFKKLGA